MWDLLAIRPTPSVTYELVQRQNIPSVYHLQGGTLSLREMVSPSLKAQTVREVFGREYKWRKMYSQEQIQKIHAERTYESVFVNSDDCYLGYASYVKAFHEAWLYPEGDILVCATTSEFAGTFASHDDVEIRYYHLTPNPNWEDLKSGGWREQYYVIEY